MDLEVVEVDRMRLQHQAMQEIPHLQLRLKEILVETETTLEGVVEVVEQLLQVETLVVQDLMQMEVLGVQVQQLILMDHQILLLVVEVVVTTLLQEQEELVELVVEVQVQQHLQVLPLLEQPTLVVVEVVEVPTILKALMVDQGLLSSDINTSNFSLL